MKSNLIAAFVLLATLITSCKIDSKDEKATTPATTAEPKKQVETKVKVTLNAVVTKDDAFEVFYTNDGSTNFDSKESVRIDVKGSTEPQKIVFYLPESSSPKNFRIDVGNNKEQGAIKFIDFTFDNFSKKFETKGSEIFKYFSVNENLALNQAAATTTPVVKGDKYDPFLWPHSTLTDDLAKMYK